MASSLWPERESRRIAARTVRRFSSVLDLRIDSSLRSSSSVNCSGGRCLGKGMSPLKHFPFKMYSYLENVDLGGELNISRASAILQASGGNGSVTVNSRDPFLQWTATSNQSWLLVTGGASGVGSGPVQW